MNVPCHFPQYVYGLRLFGWLCCVGTMLIICCTMDSNSSFSRWLWWEDVHLMWLLMRYMLLRLFVTMCKLWLTSCVLASAAKWHTNNSALITIWNHGSLLLFVSCWVSYTFLSLRGFRCLCHLMGSMIQLCKYFRRVCILMVGWVMGVGILKWCGFSFTSDTNGGMHGFLSMPFLSKHNIDPALFVK